MESELNRLLNINIEKCIEVHDYTQIYFDDKSILNINNNYKITPEINLEGLSGKKVVEISEGKEEIVIFLNDNYKIVIDMKEDAWNCPEALALLIEGDPMPIIWNE